MTPRRTTSFFGTLAALVTRNWGLKILSLLLALVIYHTIKNGSDRFDYIEHERPLPAAK